MERKQRKPAAKNTTTKTSLCVCVWGRGSLPTDARGKGYLSPVCPLCITSFTLVELCCCVCLHARILRNTQCSPLCSPWCWLSANTGEEGGGAGWLMGNASPLPHIHPSFPLYLPPSLLSCQQGWLTCSSQSRLKDSVFGYVFDD